jgi:nitronate monooxygenase
MLKTRLPWIQAPMYHYSGADLVVACSKAGILGSLSCQTPEQLYTSLEKIKQNHITKYSVNVFINSDHLGKNQPLIHPRIQNKLTEYRKELGLSIQQPDITDSYRQDLEMQMDLIKKYKVPFVIFTFGLPTNSQIQELKKIGTVLIGSCTSIEEALMIQDSGLDAVILQGKKAGGHRTSIQLPAYSCIDLETLLHDASNQVKIPYFGAGGVTHGKDIKKIMDLGASGVSIGTLFLTAKECNTPTSHRDLIYNTNSDTKTVITRLYTGRPAQMIPNRFYFEMKEIVDDLGGEDVIPWNFYARDIFGKAARVGNPELYVNWGGANVNKLSGRATMTAKDIISLLEYEYK